MLFGDILFFFFSVFRVTRVSRPSRFLSNRVGRPSFFFVFSMSGQVSSHSLLFASVLIESYVRSIDPLAHVSLHIFVAGAMVQVNIY